MLNTQLTVALPKWKKKEWVTYPIVKKSNNCMESYTLYFKGVPVKIFYKMYFCPFIMFLS